MKFLFLLMLLAHQLVVADCSDHYGDISPLKMTLAEIEGKKEVYGHLIKNQKQFEELANSLEPNVDIIYMLNSHDDLIVAPRFVLDPNDENTLVAHISLYKKLEELGLDKTIMASGELPRRNAKTSALSNKSGTFKGSMTHLEKAQRVFVDLKVISKETKLLDYSTKEIPDNHVDDVELARNYKEISKSKKQTELFNEIEKMYFEFSELFPDKTKEGFIDQEVMFLFLKNNLYERSDFMKIYEGITHIEYFQKDGLYRYSGEKVLQKVRDQIEYSLKAVKSN